MSTKITDGITAMIKQQLEAFNQECVIATENAIGHFIGEANLKYSKIIEELDAKLNEYSKIVDQLKECVKQETRHKEFKFNKKTISSKGIEIKVCRDFKAITKSILSKIECYNQKRISLLKGEVKAYIGENTN